MLTCAFTLNLPSPLSLRKIRMLSGSPIFVIPSSGRVCKNCKIVKFGKRSLPLSPKSISVDETKTKRQLRWHLREAALPDVHPAVDIAGVLARLHRQHTNREGLEPKR